MNVKSSQDNDTTRIERQVCRLRNQLANAWACQCPAPVIHRLEKMIARRWQLLDRVRDRYADPQPA